MSTSQNQKKVEASSPKLDSRDRESASVRSDEKDPGPSADGRGHSLFRLMWWLVLLFGVFLVGRAVGTRPQDEGIGINDLRKALTDTREEVRNNAVQIIGKMGDTVHKTVPELANRLKDESEKVRREAAKALGKMGGAARKALPKLQQALEDTSEEVRNAARCAIDRIQEALKEEKKDKKPSGSTPGKELEADRNSPERSLNEDPKEKPKLPSDPHERVKVSKGGSLTAEGP